MVIMLRWIVASGLARRRAAFAAPRRRFDRLLAQTHMRWR
jgi:hypothetical protein